MSALSQRVVRLIVASPLKNDYRNVSLNAVQIEELRVQFRVTKTLTKHPNTAEITVTNLAEKTRAQMQAKGSRVILSAGYVGSLAQIFSGDARNIDHTRQGTDWESKLECGDGERAYRFAHVSESFRGPVPVATVVRKLVEGLGIDAGNLSETLASVAGHFVSGYAAHGRASVELDKVLAGQGFTWSIQDGRFQLLRSAEDTTKRVVVLGPDSGLVGSPELGTPEKKGKPPVLKVRSLLQAEIAPGAQLQLEAEHHKGRFKILKVDHTGDTAGTDWYTDAEVVAL